MMPKTRRFLLLAPLALPALLLPVTPFAAAAFAPPKGGAAGSAGGAATAAAAAPAAPPPPPPPRRSRSPSPRSPRASPGRRGFQAVEARRIARGRCDVDGGGDGRPPPPMDRRDALAVSSAAILSPAVARPLLVSRPAWAKSSTGGGGGTSSAPPAPVYADQASLSRALQTLWDLDAPGRLIPGRDYALDLQGGKRPGNPADAAPRPLFRYVDDRVFVDRPTYRSFVALLDNYEADTSRGEDSTDAEADEARAFLRAAMATAPMEFCRRYCRSVDPDRVPESEGAFLDLLYRIWFRPYRRGKGSESPNSSGFEHVFVGEVDRSGGADEGGSAGGGASAGGPKVIGFHNWIQLYLEERRGNLDYRGYVRPKKRRPSEGGGAGAGAVLENVAQASDGTDRVITLQFTWNGAEKYVGTTLVGVSPEFELALFTTVFLVGRRDNVVTWLDGMSGRRFELDAKCFPIAKGKVGSCYLESPAQREG